MSGSSPPAGDPLLSVYAGTHRRRQSQSDSRSRSPSPLPHPSISSSPTPSLSSPPQHPPSSVPSSLLSASATVQQAAGSWWKKANALYQQATAPPNHSQPHHPSHPPPSGAHARRASADASLPLYPTVSSSPTPQRPAFSASPPAPAATSSTSSSSSFLSSVLSSVSAAVSSVSLPQSPSPSTAALDGSSLPSLDDAAALDALGGDGGSEFVQLDLGERRPRPPHTDLPPHSASISSSSPFSLSTATAAVSSPSPFSLAVSRMALLSSALSDEVGGYLTPSLFFPRAAFFHPSLRLPAVMQKLQALETFQAQLEDVGRAAQQRGEAQPHADGGLVSALDAALSSCRRMQNELAFSLTAIKESSTSASSSRTANADSERAHASGSSTPAEAAADGESASQSAADSTGSSGSSSGHSTVDRFSSRMKALGYSLAKSAHRMSKAALPDKMTHEQAELYIVLLQRSATHMHMLDSLFTHMKERAERKRTTEGGLEEDGEAAAVVSRLNSLGVFVCEVVVVLVVDDVQRAMLRYVTEQHEALLRGVRLEGSRQHAQAEEGREAAAATGAADAVPPFSAPSHQSSSVARVLFLCRSNSCRSQMAEAWTRRLHSPSLLLASSAGVLPPKAVDPRAVQVMQEVGVDMSQAQSKELPALLAGQHAAASFDVVVTLCDSDCPSVPGHPRLLHQHFDDPPQLTEGMDSEAERLHVYRRVRDELQAYVQQLPVELQLHRHADTH